MAQKVILQRCNPCRNIFRQGLLVKKAGDYVSVSLYWEVV